jgi:hypothetical protein
MKKNSSFVGILAILLVLEMTIIGCDNGTTDGGGGGDQRATLKGTWIKDTGDLQFEYTGGGGDQCYFRKIDKAGSAVLYGTLGSYNGTTAELKTWPDPVGDPVVVSFTVKLSGNTITVSGLGGDNGYGFDYNSLNGNYTK